MGRALPTNAQFLVKRASENGVHFANDPRITRETEETLPSWPVAASDSVETALRRSGMPRIHRVMLRSRKTSPLTWPGMNWLSDRALRSLPGRRTGGRLQQLLHAQLLKDAREHRGQGRDLENRRIPADDPNVGTGCLTRTGLTWAGLACAGLVSAGHSGMFPCFLGGRMARFVRSARSPFTTATRVAAG